MSETSLRSVAVERTNTGHYTATNARGGTLHFATASDDGENAAFTPVELLLAAIGGCTAADVDAAISRHAEPATFSLSVTGDKISDDQGNRMTDLTVTFDVTFPEDDGEGEGEGAERARAILPRAIKASHDRLCTVSRTIEIGTPVTTRIKDA
ncbi:OsmC family protein [Streptomyces sp. 15-116A]|uniref:OsmC family protein n=1 Tax=Streptomyces sp. 15-116A TaxID=2259035 RepID=UPI0021B28F40|nr:OsmC family protein [Streptomyces sp. 15-116A]MCT7356620.1 OsmC family protein [Streptomyces sp. 15-116A]